ncbi:hypothetical protein [Mycobacterium hubeiense]|uniref:hypothetical protein n=1 Tax=Mycobacterium hubeiense TaxID=1867256 RepID=UPI000C7F4B45|nr:hypothetical protein [Mycobacterium sp. QGD 101]
MVSPYKPPPIESATDPIHSPADMGQRWRALMGELGFGERLLRFAFVGPDRRLIKMLGEAEIRLSPEPVIAENLLSALKTVLGDDLPAGSTVALLLTRPGRGPISNADRRWATLLTETAARLGVPIEPFFRANDESLVQVEPEPDLEEVAVGR